MTHNASDSHTSSKTNRSKNQSLFEPIIFFCYIPSSNHNASRFSQTLSERSCNISCVIASKNICVKLGNKGREEASNLCDHIEMHLGIGFAIFITNQIEICFSANLMSHEVAKGNSESIIHIYFSPIGIAGSSAKIVKCLERRRLVAQGIVRSFIKRITIRILGIGYSTKSSSSVDLIGSISKFSLTTDFCKESASQRADCNWHKQSPGKCCCSSTSNSSNKSSRS